MGRGAGLERGEVLRRSTLSTKSTMNPQAYDLIGDIHGQHDKLVIILRALG